MARGKPASAMGARIISALGGRTQRWLSEQAAIPRQTLNKAIVHGTMLSADKAIAVARALDVPVEWLVLGDAPAREDGFEQAVAKVARVRTPALVRWMFRLFGRA